MGTKSGLAVSQNIHLPDFQICFFQYQIIYDLEEKFVPIYLPDGQFHLPRAVGLWDMSSPHSAIVCWSQSREGLLTCDNVLTRVIGLNMTKLHVFLKAVNYRSLRFHSINKFENYYITVTFFISQRVNIDSSPPSAADMRQWIGTALVQVMVCRLFGAKPLPEPVLTYCQLYS